MELDLSHLEEVTEEIRVALTENPSGMTRKGLYDASSSDSLLTFTQILHNLIAKGEVVNLSGTSLGPYVLFSCLSKNTPDIHMVSTAVPQQERRKEPRVMVDTNDRDRDPGKSRPKLYGIPTPPKTKVKVTLGTLDPKTPIGVVAYSLYLISKDRPEAFVTYDYVVSRIPSSLKIRDSYTRGMGDPYGKGRAALFRVLEANGYCERSYPAGKPKSPMVRWLPKSKAYPFSNTNIKLWEAGQPVSQEGDNLRPERGLSEAQKVIAKTMGSLILTRSEVAPTEEEKKPQGENDLAERLLQALQHASELMQEFLGSAAKHKE